MKIEIILSLVLFIICGVRFFILVHRVRNQVETDEKYPGLRKSEFPSEVLADGDFPHRKEEFFCLRLDWFIWLTRYFFIGISLPAVAIIIMKMGISSWAPFAKLVMNGMSKSGGSFILIFAGLIMIWMVSPVILKLSERGLEANAKLLSVKSFQIDEVMPNFQILYLRTASKVWMLFSVVLEEKPQSQNERREKSITLVQNYLYSQGAKDEKFSPMRRSMWKLGAIFVLFNGAALMLLVIN